MSFASTPFYRKNRKPLSAQTAFCFFCRLKDYNVSFFRCKAGACMKNALRLFISFKFFRKLKISFGCFLRIKGYNV